VLLLITSVFSGYGENII